jgi:hypothetical protein
MSKPLGYGDVGKMLYNDLKQPGDQASVLSTSQHNGHVDAYLYQKAQDGRIYQVDKHHLDPKTLKPRNPPTYG